MAEAVGSAMMSWMAVIFLFLCSFPLAAQEHQCTGHPYTLNLKETGFEHVNHLLLLNGKVPVTELAESMWFIERITCTPGGYELLASHRQYGDNSMKVFKLKIVNREQYEIIAR